ncbi:MULTISPECIES: dipeptidase [Sphingomonas]|nr:MULTISPECIES: membrane dipeptidase [Sphingomonas]
MAKPAAADPRARYSPRARRIVEQALVIDMLAPPRLDLSETGWTRPLSDKERADFRTSGITGMHNAIGIGGPDARVDALTFLAAQQGFAGRNADVFSLVGSVADLDRAKAERKIGMIMGLQNAEQFETTKDVPLFYGLGLRCAQLTYNSQNRIGSGCTDRVDGGVSDYGAEIVAEMNKAGMLVDVSHSGDRTTLDAIALSQGPIAITHANCRALSHHPRGKTDEAIVALARKGGVIGISGVRQFVKDRDPTTVADVADHIEHVVKLTAVEHVGIGSDADLNGYDDMAPDQYKALKAAYKSSYAFRDRIDIEGFDHPRKMYDLTEELIRRGWSDANIALVLGGNFRRLLAATWQ